MLEFLQEEVFVAKMRLLAGGTGRDCFEDYRVRRRGTIDVDGGSGSTSEQSQGGSRLTALHCDGGRCCGGYWGYHVCGKVSII